jgi:hypothetical protein
VVARDLRSGLARHALLIAALIEVWWGFGPQPPLIGNPPAGAVPRTNAIRGEPGVHTPLRREVERRLPGHGASPGGRRVHSAQGAGLPIGLLRLLGGSSNRATGVQKGELRSEWCLLDLSSEGGIGACHGAISNGICGLRSYMGEICSQMSETWG